MKAIALLSVLTVLLSGNLPAQEQWLYLNEVHINKPEQCPDKKLEVVLRTAGKEIKLNKLYDVKIRIDESTTIVVFVDGDSMAVFSPALWCYPSLEYSPFIVQIKYSGNCNDCFVINTCYEHGAQTITTERESVPPEDSLMEFAGLNLCAKNYIQVTLRAVNSTLGKVIYEEIE